MAAAVITIKIDGRPVEVINQLCRWMACLQVGRYTHHSAAGASGCSSWTEKGLCCLRNANQGCPPAERRFRVGANQVHPCEQPRFAFTIRTVTSPSQTVECLTCHQRVPKWAAQEQQGEAT